MYCRPLPAPRAPRWRDWVACVVFPPKTSKWRENIISAESRQNHTSLNHNISMYFFGIGVTTKTSPSNWTLRAKASHLAKRTRPQGGKACSEHCQFLSVSCSYFMLTILVCSRSCVSSARSARRRRSNGVPKTRCEDARTAPQVTQIGLPVEVDIPLMDEISTSVF